MNGLQSMSHLIGPIHDKYPGNTTAEKELNRIIDNLQNANKKGIRITVGSDSFCSSLTLMENML